MNFGWQLKFFSYQIFLYIFVLELMFYVFLFFRCLIVKMSYVIYM